MPDRRMMAAVFAGGAIGTLARAALAAAATLDTTRIPVRLQRSARMPEGTSSSGTTAA
jgi:hypothetical protein